MKELLEKFNYNLTRIKKLPESREIIKANNKKLEQELVELQDKITLIQDSRVAYQKTIDAFYEESIGQLEKMINCALTTIFYDRHYQIRIQLSGEDKKDKSFSFDIVNLDVGEPEDLRDGTGNGIRAVISFVITSYYLIKFNSPYLFVDELYSQISKAYVDGFFEFVHKLCDEHGLVFVLITHDERFLNYADQVVQVSEGRVTIHNDLNIDKIEQLVKDVERYNNEEKVTK